MKANDSVKVAVLYGGIGAEREVSLQSGTCVAEALREAGFDVVKFDIRPDRLDIIADATVDVFFPVLHGEFGEDGQLQQILESAADGPLAYTGSGPQASRLAFDKLAAKKLFAGAGVTTPVCLVFGPAGDSTEFERKLDGFADKYVVKPVRQGSSVGISIVSEPGQAIDAARKTAREYGDCFIEKFVAGRELTVGILCGRALPIIEIRPKSVFYDYHAKYVDDRTEFVFGTTDAATTAKVQDAAMRCFDTLGCRDFARVDFILADDGTPYALEVNTIPGFTNHSLLPKAAMQAGFSISQTCEMIVRSALTRKKVGSSEQARA